MSEVSASVTWLTGEAYNRLKQELDELVENRPVVAAKVNASREEGDLKENGGYHAAREEQRQAEARIRHLRGLLRNARITEAPGGDGLAEPGKVLTIRYEGDDEMETFLLATRAEGVLDVYSPESPLGKVLLGAREGETRSYQLPNGVTQRVTLVKVVPYTDPDRAPGDRRAKQRLWPTSVMNTDLESTATSREIPVALYVSDEHAYDAVHDALLGYLAANDIVVVERGEPKRGSITQWFRARRIAGDIDPLTFGRRVIEMQALEKEQAKIDGQEADAVAKLVGSLGDTKNALIQIGSLLLLKVDGNIVVRNLAQQEMVLLRRKSSELASPELILKALEDFARDEGRQERNRPAGLPDGPDDSQRDSA